MSYDYQHCVAGLTFDQAMVRLRGIVPVVEGEADVGSPEAMGAIAEHLVRCGVALRDWSLSAARYQEFFAAARYSERFPTYYRDNLTEKSLEHFAALELLKPGRRDVFLDIASERSPLALIASEQHRCRAYGQDYMYPPGMTDRCPYDLSIAAADETRWWRRWLSPPRVCWLGGDACALDLPDGFASKATLTCSLEHFEGASDTALFRELARVVRPGGRVVIIPLYLSPEPFTQTDPVYSCDGQVPFDGSGVIRAVRGWGNRHGRFYSAATLRERIVDVAAPWFDFTVLRLQGLDKIAGHVYARFALVANRTAVRFRGSSR